MKTFHIKCALFALFAAVNLLFAAPALATQIDIAGPTGGGSFGLNITVLPNGNIVVADPYYSIPGGAANVGAVYLYDGATLALISTLTGSAPNDYVGFDGVRVLTTGNYVIISSLWDNGAAVNAGATTFGNATTGVSGAVSATNSLVSSFASNTFPPSLSVAPLNNGNYLVNAPGWNNSRGAATFGNGTTGVIGLISESNSLVGSTVGDSVGNNGITILPNGNYLVISPSWRNGAAAKAGAVTFGNGTTGVSGLVSGSNSLIGSQPDDYVGQSITVLANGNYVVGSGSWDDGSIANAGAATFGSGSTGVSGIVSASNSLIGTSPNDQVGGETFTGNFTIYRSYIVALTNGNYVVGSPNWDNGAMTDAGAATFGNGTTGVSGLVSISNSLVGSNFGSDRCGSVITPLTNGNYTVTTLNFDNGQVYDAGAVTFGSGATGVRGTISVANSLIGSNHGDFVGNVTPLTNGNYVVATPSWDGGAVANVGAATFGSGATGVVGYISAANSLIGSTAGDTLTAGGVNSGIQPLPNGNYVISSPNWRNGTNTIVGAVTFGNGTVGTAGIVSTSNSLVGSTADDRIGFSGITVLSNSNYIVVNQYWDNGAIADAGAITFGSGTNGVSGAVSIGNSLVGSSLGAYTVTALTNGNYVVRNPFWDNGSITDVGAVTFGNGTTGTTGVISSSNSLIGSTAGDGNGSNVYALTNGNYVVAIPNWDDGVVANAGAVAFGNGAIGVTGTISASNSLIGSMANDQTGSGGVTALSNGNYVVRSGSWDNPSPAVSNASAATFGNGASGTIGAISSANSVVGTVTNGTNNSVFDPTRNRLFVGRVASNVISVLVFNTTAIADGNINNPANFDNGLPDALVNAVIPNGRNIALNAKMNVGQVRVECGGALSGGSSAAYIVGSIRKNFCAAANENFLYAVGDPNNYSPLRTTNASGTGSVTVSVTDATLPGLPPPLSVSRYWSLSGAGITTDLSFTYTDGDVNGNESAYNVYKRLGGVNARIVPSAVNQATNTATVTGVSSFSDWGIGSLFEPTAAGISISGKVLTPQGAGLTNALVTLTDARGESQTVRTGKSGSFIFTDVAAGETYILSVASKRYDFTPQIIAANEDVAELDFTPR